jgi:hypothetical protein
MTLSKEQKRERKGEFLSCIKCGKEFYVYPSTLKKSKKRGSYPQYCSMACYDKTGENNPFWGKNHSAASIDKMVDNPNRPRFLSGKDNPNFIRFGDGSGFMPLPKTSRKERLIKKTGGCQRCDVVDTRILTVHHIDRNQKNNDDSNLEILCWNCHVIEHREKQDGMFANLTKKGSKKNEVIYEG